MGAVLMASSYSLAQFIVARLVLGFGTGGYVATVPVWHSELSKPAKRGSDVVTPGLFIGIGISMSIWIDLGFYFLDGTSVAWRISLVLQVVLSLVVMCSIFLLPESPRWLIKKGREAEARDILAMIENVDVNSLVVSEIVTRTQLSLETGGSASLWSLFKQGEQRLFHRTMLADWGQIFQQICGVNAISFYATVIFQMYLGLDATKSRVLAAAMSSFQCVGGVVAYHTIDRFGRRILMLTSAASMAVLMAILAGSTSLHGNQGALIVAIVTLFLFLFMFAVGFAGLTFLYATEVAPLQYRAAINALSTAAVWIANFLLAQVTPVGFKSIKYRYYLVFACISAEIVPTVFFLFLRLRACHLRRLTRLSLVPRQSWTL